MLLGTGQQQQEKVSLAESTLEVQVVALMMMMMNLEEASLEERRLVPWMALTRCDGGAVAVLS